MNSVVPLYSDPDTSFLAARYLNHALRSILEGNDLYCLADIWHSYMDVAASQPEAVEWSIFNECIKILHSSDNPFASFVSPVRLARLARPLLQFSSHLYFSFITLNSHNDPGPPTTYQIFSG